MKDDFIPSFVSQMDRIDPAVERAQRMAELEQIAKYRKRKLQHYLDWSDPEKRAKKQAEIQADIEEAYRIANERAAKDPNYINSLRISKTGRHIGLSGYLPIYEPLDKRIKITEIHKISPGKLKWYQRIMKWFK